MIDVGPLHFLRPAWLLALLALPALAWWLRRHASARADWQRAIDPHLLPYLLEPGNDARRRWLAVIAALAYTVATLALAGPAWRQVDEPGWQSREPLVVAVDLSSASLAADVPPTRVAQLRARLSRLLQVHRDGPVALVAFADDAFTVAPLTDDAANVALFVDALEPSVMPVDGQSPARAIAWSRQLIDRAGFAHGRIVLITDHADSEAQRAASEARAAGDVVSAIGLGTPAGAVVRTPGGATVHVALDEASLRALARAGGGDYARLSLTGADDAVFAVASGPGSTHGLGGRAWADDGVRLLPLVLLLALVLLARRPRIAAAMLVIALVPRPSFASDLWLRPDQRAHRAVERGIEQYRRGNFAAAADSFARSGSADALYDRGNALAKAGKLEDAVAAYDMALKRSPGMADALANRAAVLAALKRQQNDKGDNQGNKGDPSKDSQKSRNCAPGDANCKGRQQPSRQPRNGSASQPSQRSQSAAPPKPGDAAKQAQADAAQRERMQRAVKQAQAKPGEPASPKLTPEQRERKLSDDAALMRVPDEPGNLLREKFRLEHERRQSGGSPP
ncbi:tetratricopeptide repeat protein [Cognatilysobacter lacus]|uniref:Tetratricopeptide repeat protein n=1 Tax=Cognatilysobacter lacus TaxID=1643323 RepID=A0A5D8Z1M0_9GAMM|nr:VWA domain-containing protein [Lysobacter lacus]TZF88560.1 tetratricopeptide repeat protein [Lysobacter lacus]